MYCTQEPLGDLRKKYAITIKPFFSEKCTFTASKAEAVKRDSKILKSGILRMFGRRFINIPNVAVTMEGKSEHFFGFWSNQYIFVPNHKSISWRYSKN